jgi:hypothetical protein
VSPRDHRHPHRAPHHHRPLARRRLRRPHVARERARARRARRVVLRADALATDVDLFERAVRKSSNDVLGQNDARRRLEPFPSDMTRYRKLALAARRAPFDF